MQIKEPRIIVIGTSAGGLPPLMELLRPLPQDLNAAILVVQHIPPHSGSSLATILETCTPLRVEIAQHELPLEPGVVYTAVNDHHLLVEDGRMLVTRGPKENRFRPSIDALFRSAAFAHRHRIIGVVLSGALNDGTSGAWSIKHYGGTVIVQDPAEAQFSDMPTSVQRYVTADHVLTARRIADQLIELCQETLPTGHIPPSDMNQDKLTEIEINIAKGKSALEQGVIEAGTPSSLTCPDCHGAMTRYEQGGMKRYRCHTGHAHTTETLLAGIEDNIEHSLWEVMRGMEEGKLLLDSMTSNLRNSGRDEAADLYQKRSAELAERSQRIKELIFARQQIDEAILEV